MPDNIKLTRVSPYSGAYPEDTAFETNQQAGGEHRPVVSIGDSALPAGAATAAAQTDGTQVSNVLFHPSNLSAFGVLETAELTPVLQGDFIYGLNTQVWQTPTTSGTGATVDTNGSRLRVQSGTDAAGYSYLPSRRPVRYRAGEGVVYRATPIFATGIADSVQFQGMGTIVSNAPYDGYGFGYNGVDFGIFHYNRGTPTFIPSANFSHGFSFAFDPTKGTPLCFKYPYLGYGDILFFAENPDTARPELIHVIKFANTTNVTQLSNPALNMLAYVKNSGNTSNLIMYCGSYGIFISGVRSFANNPRWGMDSYKASVTTETNIISIRNATTYNGIPNRALIRLSFLSLGLSAANGISTIRFKSGVTLGGSPSFTPVSGSTADNGVTITGGNSIASFDVAGTTVTNGAYFGGVVADNPNSQSVDLERYDLYIAPGETLTISGFSTIASTIAIGVNWSEDI